MKKKTLWLIVGIVAVLLLILVYPWEKQAAQSDYGKKSSGPVREIKIVSSKFSFNPSTVTVKEGERLRLVLSSSDVPHGLAIPGYGINLVVEAGQEKKMEFTADKKGVFPFACSVYCGQGHSRMRGELVVK